MRPYYLDGDLTDFDHIPLQGCGLHRSGDTRFSAAAYRWRLMWHCAVFKDRGEAYNVGRSRAKSVTPLTDVSTRTPADAGLSKLNSMLG